MYNGVLQKLIRSGKPVLYTDLKLTAAKAKPLIALGLVTPVVIQITKSKRKTPNAIKINAKGNKENIVPFTKMDKLLTTMFANLAAIAIERALMTREIILRMITVSIGKLLVI